MDYAAAFQAVIDDPRYQRNLDWGEARPGHPEGTIRAHIAEIEPNLEALRPRLSEVDVWKLKLLIHTMIPSRLIQYPEFPLLILPATRPWPSRFSPNLLTMKTCWRCSNSMTSPRTVAPGQIQGNLQPTANGYATQQYQRLDLFLAFIIIDGCTKGKSREPLLWLFKTLEGKVTSNFTAEDIVA